MGKFHKLALNFSGWPFIATVTRYLRPKSDHANEWVYRKSIDRSMEVFLETFLLFFGYRKKHFWKKFCQKTSSMNLLISRTFHFHCSSELSRTFHYPTLIASTNLSTVRQFLFITFLTPINLSIFSFDLLNNFEQNHKTYADICNIL